MNLTVMNIIFLDKYLICSNKVLKIIDKTSAPKLTQIQFKKYVIWD